MYEGDKFTSLHGDTHVRTSKSLVPKACSLTPPKKAQLRAPLSPLQTACKPVRRAPTSLTTALVAWNALLTILAPGVWQTLCQSQCPC